MNFKKSIAITAILSLFIVGNLFANDLYWVGNSGNWSDPAHWSNTSGGNGGASTPTSNDNVYFDNNSFTASNPVVTVNNNAALHNLSIQYH